MTYSITQYGEPLDPSKYTIDLKNQTFSTGESYLIFDFTGEREWTFKTGSYCTFITGPNCIFRTEWGCTFDTGSSCTFLVGEVCVIIRRDIFEIIQPEPQVQIKLNESGIPGYQIITQKKTITIDGEEMEITQEYLDEIKLKLAGE